MTCSNTRSGPSEPCSRGPSPGIHSAPHCPCSPGTSQVCQHRCSWAVGWHRNPCSLWALASPVEIQKVPLSKPQVLELTI